MLWVATMVICRDGDLRKTILILELERSVCEAPLFLTTIQGLVGNLKDFVSKLKLAKTSFFRKTSGGFVSHRGSPVLTTGFNTNFLV